MTSTRLMRAAYRRPGTRETPLCLVPERIRFSADTEPASFLADTAVVVEVALVDVVGIVVLGAVSGIVVEQPEAAAAALLAGSRTAPDVVEAGLARELAAGGAAAA